MAQSPLPTGEQYHLSQGQQHAVVVEVGAGLRSYSVGGLELLDTYPEAEMAEAGRGQLLIPWPNRLSDGAYQWKGRRLQVALNEPTWHNAIHGLVRWRPWQLITRTESSITMGHLLHPTPGYPFTLRSTIQYTLSGSGLMVTIGAENAGPEPLPYGAGQHPYLRLSRGLIDDAELRIPARTQLLTDARGIPTGETPVSGDFDFLHQRRLGSAVLDTAYTDLVRDRDGLARVIYRDGDATLTLWLDDGFPHLMVFTGDSLPAIERRRRGLGVEPMTCAPNALQSGRDLIRLEPRQMVSASWGLSLD